MSGKHLQTAFNDVKLQNHNSNFIKGMSLASVPIPPSTASIHYNIKAIELYMTIEYQATI